MEKTGAVSRADSADIVERIESLAAACREILQSEGCDRIQAIFLYGSSLERRLRPDSDVDFAVLDDKDDRLSWSDQSRLMDALERLTGKGVDL
ncbi:MAG TPA: nucleotidyltransferase domain-containing protein, partial [Thermoanaerobaculia bacterium]|nr:nucleotidyltransferase domain-containing protein [Thermoanaerobaculia bacterium]